MELGLKLRDLAASTGLSVPFLSQIENDAAKPSLASLFTIASELGTTPERLLAGPTEAPVVLVRADDGPTYAVTDSSVSAMRRQLTSPGEPFSSAEYVAEPGSDLGGFYASAGRELLHVTSGGLAVDLRDGNGVVTHELSAGDTLLYATSTEHRWRQYGPETTRFVHVVSPI
jgi:transcriptional regulator with XRE-family HTH domain